MEALKDKLSIIAESIHFLLPELILVGAIILFILLDLIFKKQGHRIVIILAIGVIFLILGLGVGQLLTQGQKSIPLFLNMLELSQGSLLWKIVIDAGALFTLFIHLRNNLDRYKSEFIYVILVMLLGGHLLVMSSNLLMVYLSIELLSIGAYVLTVYSFKEKGYEAGVKYLLFGGVSSAVLLYGLSLIYTFTGTLHFLTPEFIELLMEVETLPMLVAGIMVIGGILFKITAAPMHIWAPDVYQVAPTSSVAFFSIVPKLAGFAILIKWMLAINLFGLGEVPWPKIMGAIALLTLTVGNFSALRQSNIKRLLAYSSIAHSGFLLLGIVAFSTSGHQSLLFYAIIYLLMNMAAFALANFFEQKHECIEVSDLKGMIKYYPYLTVLTVVTMIALTGLPPTAGFTAKLFVFSAIWESYTNTDQSWLILVFVIGLLNAVVSLFYYLKIPYFMIFRNSDKEYSKVGLQPENYLITILVVGILVLFFKPDWLMNIINSINFAF